MLVVLLVNIVSHFEALHGFGLQLLEPFVDVHRSCLDAENERTVADGAVGADEGEVIRHIRDCEAEVGFGLVETPLLCEVDSVAADEWKECKSKGAFLTRDRPAIDLIETMRFDPSDGVIELDRHLDRLMASAEALQFRFNRHAARNELQAATFGRRAAATARLVLSSTGAMAIEVRPA